jgi:glycosyltransferase involved in cell wall biosynthesis
MRSGRWSSRCYRYTIRMPADGRSRVAGRKRHLLVDTLVWPGPLPWVLSRLPPGYRAIVADNGSTDGSTGIATDDGATVVPVAHRGFGAAAHAGLEAATCEAVCFFDEDGSMDPVQLPRVAGPLLADGCDLTLGRRRPTARGAWPAHARLANIALTVMLRRRRWPGSRRPCAPMTPPMTRVPQLMGTRDE